MQNMKLAYPILIEGSKPGPTSVILAGVHGNEPAGILAFEKIIPLLVVDAGKVIFDIGNPEAVKKGIRFMDINLNRMLLPDERLTAEQKETLEYGRSREIMQLLESADALLDIHTSRNEKSKVFAICEDNSLEIAAQLPVNLVCKGFDEYHPGSTDGFMKDKIGICIECGQHLDLNAGQVAYRAIHAFLVAMGHLEKGNVYVYKQKILNIFHLHRNKMPFVRSKKFVDFEAVPANMIIGSDGDEEIRAPEDCTILFALDAAESGSECFLLAKEKK
jgi:succinylglutamate desuccinylase